tara:strand:+ start:583 stop:1566 length:984 start_codon:yes stop_codon:yes gene_type:complete
MNIKKEIKKYNYGRSRINNPIIIVGCGRWGKVILKEISTNFKKIKRIYVYTNYINQLKKFAERNKIKNLEIFKDFRKLKTLKISHGIVVKKNNLHFKFAKKLIKHNCNVLVEKPFTRTINQAKTLERLSQKRKILLCISLPFFYAYYFYFVKKNIIKKDKIKSLNFYWFDKPNEFRHNAVKKFDTKINYIEDIFYHIFSISSIFCGKGIFTFPKKELKLNNYKTITSIFKNKKITINCSRNWKRRLRKLEINLVNGKKLSINFSKNVIIKLMGKKISYILEKKNRTLKYQLFNFLKLNNYNSRHNLNDIRELSDLFTSLRLLKRQIN